MKMTHTEYKNATKRQKEENEWLNEMKTPTIEEMFADAPIDAVFMEETMRYTYTIKTALKKAL